MDNVREEGAEPIRDAFKSFLSEVKSLSQLQKVKEIYTYFTTNRPDPHLDTDTLLNRVLYEQRFGIKIKETQEQLEKSKWKFSWKSRSEMKASKKKSARDLILVFYLNIKGEMEKPKLYPLYSGNMVIIRNKPYEVDPRAFWTLDKYKCMVFREIDRRPVSNLDYSEVKARGDATDSDEFLIKAAMKALQGGIKKPMNKGVIILIVIAAIAAALFFFFSK